MKPVGPTQYFKVEKDGVLEGLFRSNSPDVIDMQIKALSDMQVIEVDESEYRQLQETAAWNTD